MKWSSSQRQPDGSRDHHAHPEGGPPMWLAPSQVPPPLAGDADHHVRLANHDASHTSLRTVDSAVRFLRSLGYVR